MGYEDDIASRLMGARKGKLNEFIDANTIDRVNKEIERSGDAIDALLRLASRIGDVRFSGHVNGLSDAWDATSDSAEGLESRENLESVNEATDYKLIAEVLSWAHETQLKANLYAFHDVLEPFGMLKLFEAIHAAAKEVQKKILSRPKGVGESKEPFGDDTWILASNVSRGMKLRGDGGKPRIVTGVYRKADHIVVQYDDGVFTGEEPYKPDEEIKLAEAEYKVNPVTGHEVLDVDVPSIARVWDSLPPFAQMTALDVIGASSTSAMQGVRTQFNQLSGSVQNKVVKGWSRIVKDLKSDPLTKKYIPEAYDPEQFKKIAAAADKEKVGGKYPEDVEWKKKTDALKKAGKFREPDEATTETENPFAQKVSGSMKSRPDSDKYVKKSAGAVVAQPDDQKYVKKSAGSVQGEGAAYGGLQASKDDETKKESSVEPWGKRFPGKITPPEPQKGPSHRPGWEREIDKNRRADAAKKAGSTKTEAKSDMSREDKRMYYSGYQVGTADKKRGNDATFKSVRAGIRSYPSWNEGFMDGWNGMASKVKSPMEFLETWVGDFEKDIKSGRGRDQS